MPDEVREIIYDFEKDGFQAHRYSVAGQWGTHVDAPIHFVREGRTIDQINVKEMLLPLVVFDVSEEVDRSPDFVLSRNFVGDWEEANGPVPKYAFVAMKSGWSKRWPNSDLIFNRDEAGVAHFPGWSIDAAEFLIDQRRVKAFGHETSDTDGGIAISKDDLSCETLILQRGLYQVEFLADLSEVPSTGAIVIAAFPKPKAGSGFPARVFAIF